MVMSNGFLPKGYSQPTSANGQWAWTNEDYSVLNPLESKIEQEETEPSNYPVYIATTIPFMV